MKDLLVACGLVATIASAAGADLIVRQRTQTSGGPSPTSMDSIEYLTATKNVNDDARSRMIVDLDAKTYTLVDKDRRTYAVMTFDDLERQVERARKELETLPADVRKQLESTSEAEVNLDPTGRTEMIAGYEATEYALRAGTTSGAIWVTTAIEVPGGQRQWRKFAGRLSGAPGRAAKLSEAIADLKGFPLRTIMRQPFGQSTLTISSEAVEVQVKPAPAEVLVVPNGYSKVAAAGLVPPK